MKKIVSLITALCILCVSFVSISATDPTTIYYNKVSGSAGDNVKVSVGIKNNVEITGLLLRIEYDPSAVKINKITNGSAFEDAMFTTPNMAADIPSPFVVSWISLDGLDTNGTILNISATLKKNMTEEYPINIVSYEANDIEEKDVNIAIDNGAIPMIYFDEKECKPGDTVEVPIMIENNPGISGIGVEIEYDNTKLTLSGIENGNLLLGAYFEYGDLNRQSVTMNWAGINNSTKNGVLVTCKFTVKDQAEIGNVPLNITVIESIDVDEIEVPLYGKTSVLKIRNPTSTPTPGTTTPPNASPTPGTTTPPSASPTPGTTTPPSASPTPGTTTPPSASPTPGTTTPPSASPTPDSTPVPIVTPSFTVDNKGTYADIINNGEENNVAVIIAEYEGNNSLKKVNVANITFSKGEKRTFMLGSGQYKIFVWNSLNAMVPMTK